MEERVTKWKNLLVPGKTIVEGFISRAGHGSSPRRPKAASQLRQPQDGSSDHNGDHDGIPDQFDASPQAPLTPMNGHARNPLREPEDAGITGGTRSLNRRVLGLNGVAKSVLAAPAAVMPQLLDALPSPRNARSARPVRPDLKRVQVA